MKKIKVISTEFQSYNSGIDVKSVMHNEDGSPIMVKSELDNREYPLGQVSSSFSWAKQDCGYERYKDRLDKLFPEENGKFEFEYELVKMETVMCCGECGIAVGEEDYKEEHCHRCGNDLLMGAWTVVPKAIMDKIIRLRNSFTF